MLKIKALVLSAFLLALALPSLVLAQVPDSMPGSDPIELEVSVPTQDGGEATDDMADLTSRDLDAYIAWCKAKPELIDQNGYLKDPDSQTAFFAEKGISPERFIILNERLSHVLFSTQMIYTPTISDSDLQLINTRSEELMDAILRR
ncbi:MAG: hypothetical protein LBE49_06325 [Deltaproteobacteria bacterium]|jgi:hypothetical protein|nr:hypothetical protein [Deltaproteobacteria bacterium]